MASLLAVALPAQAQSQACDNRTNVRVGEDTAAIAQRCGVNIEALKAANPGMRDDRPQAGTFVIAPQPSLPSNLPSVGGNSALQPVAPNMRGSWRR